MLCVSSPDAAAVHQRADDIHAGDARDDGEDAAGGAAGPLQDLGHAGHRQPHARVPLQSVSYFL